ncbi:MAG: 16S rRNA (guanine(966)-N(2))-methyltransferase RsmD [Ruminococcaceae bacterium]|nr:16S rRNA (guanine(966)-N(2))-methyltransferase RsmD [Oscillospiraceae bacterium]
MRIIAGDARGRRLATLPGQDTRPTLERVKEGMFSAVQFWLPGARVLDLFCGSGQLGLEALSRGAASCVFVDNARAAADVARKNIGQLGYGRQARVVQADATAFLARGGEMFDLIVMDPPYRGGYYPALIQAVAPRCAPEAIVLCESAPAQAFPDIVAGLRLEKQYRYGAVMVTRYRSGPGGE